MPPAAGAVWKARESQLRALRVGFFGELCEITVFPRAARQGEWKKNKETYFWCSCKQAEPRDPGDDLPLQSRIIWGGFISASRTSLLSCFCLLKAELRSWKGAEGEARQQTKHDLILPVISVTCDSWSVGEAKQRRCVLAAPALLLLAGVVALPDCTCTDKQRVCLIGIINGAIISAVGV